MEDNWVNALIASKGLEETYGHDALECPWLAACGPAETLEPVIAPQVMHEEYEELYAQTKRSETHVSEEEDVV